MSMKVSFATLALLTILVGGCAGDDFAMRTRVETLEAEVSTLRSAQSQLATDSQSNSEAIENLASAIESNSQSITNLAGATRSNTQSIRIVSRGAR